MILDPGLENQLRAQRALCGGDRFDEVWEGVYMMSPLADNQHQEIASGLVAAIRNALGWNTSFRIFPGVNVSDREQDWEHNYRCPDLAIFSKNTKAKNCGTHWWGGPDFAIEITSPNDRSREKLDFYGKVGVEELLLIDRSTWTFELYRLDHDELKLNATSRLAEGLKDGQPVLSQVLGVAFRILAGAPRHIIEVASAKDRQKWLV
jgi:Uma2 family endonuclease